MKHLIIIAIVLLTVCSNVQAMEADTVWGTNVGSSVNDYKISPDEKNILLERDGFYTFLEAETGNVLWDMPADGLTTQFFFLPNQANKVLVIKDLSHFYILDTQLGAITDSIIIEGGSDRIPSRSDLSFDGRYLAGTYVTKYEYIHYLGGGGATHGFYKLYVVDLLEKRVLLDGAEMISAFTVKFSNRNNKLIRQFFNTSRLDYILFENLVTESEVKLYTKELMHIHTIDHFPGYVDIDFMHTKDAFIAFNGEGKFQRYSYETGKIDSIFSPYSSAGQYSLIDISNDDKYLAVTYGFNSLIEIENGKNFILDLESSGWYNLKFLDNRLNILYQREWDMWLLNYDYITPVTNEETEYQTIYPNPTNSEAVVVFNVNVPSEFNAKLYDVNSNILLDTSLGTLSTGQNEYNLSLNNYAPGTYFLTIQSATERFSFKIIRGE